MFSMSSESDASSSEPRNSTSATPPDSHDMAPASDSSSSGPRSPTSATPLPNFYEAAHAVLNTNELICEIIGYLPLEDIVATTGVCRTWRYALKGSLAIQQALFLVTTDIRRIATNTQDFPERVEDIHRRSYRVVGELNLFLARICGPMLSHYDHRRKISASQLGTMSPRESFEHPAGLWRDMLITQPPISYVRVCLHRREFKVFVPLREKSYSSQCDEGIRMGQIYDLIESKAKAPQTQFAIRVFMPDFHQEYKHSDLYHSWDWEVRKGEVVRPLPPQLCDDSS
jgi:hypothetical protein